ncbi:MAG: hypothetical protein ACXWXS_04605 [Actinomycetota bacterium]
MRRGTAITLIVLFTLLVVTAAFQLTQDAPDTPFPGPVSGTPLPPAETSSVTPEP